MSSRSPGEHVPRPTWTFLKESFLYTPAVVAPAVAGMVTIFVLTRLLDPRDYGHYALAMATAVSLSAVFGDWLTPTTIRFAPEAGDQRRFVGKLSSLTSAMLLVAISAAAVVIATVAPTAYVLPGVLVVVGLVTTKVVGALARAEGRTNLYSALNVVGSLGSTILGIALLMATDSPQIVLWATGIVTLFVMVGFARRIHAHGFMTRFVRLRESKALLMFGLPMMVSGLGSQALLLADRYLLDALASDTAVGLYVPNYALAERTIGFVFAPLFSALYPIIVRAWARDDHEEVTRYLETAQRMFLLLGGFIASLLLVFSRSISQVAVGTDFVPGSEVIGPVALGTLFWYQGILFHQPLEMSKKTISITVQVIVAGVVSIALNVVLIPLFGISGAAWATLVSYVFYMSCAFVVSRRSTGIRIAVPWDTWARVAGFALLLLWVRMQLEPPLAVALPLAAAAYVLFMWITREPGFARGASLIRRRG